jgi:hypothetical protein
MKYGVISMIPRPNASSWSQIEEFPQAKEVTDDKVKDQNNVDLLFRRQGELFQHEV